MLPGLDNRPLSRGSTPTILGPQKVSFASSAVSLFGATVFKSVAPIGPVIKGQTVRINASIAWVPGVGSAAIWVTNQGNTSQAATITFQNDKNAVLYSFSGGVNNVRAASGANTNWSNAMPVMLELSVCSDGSRTTLSGRVMHANLVASVSNDPSIPFNLAAGLMDVYAASPSLAFSDIYSCVAQIG
jgi:hypothetical protein